jgi:uncharacterized membrane protein (UPF0127 family)
MSLLTAVCASSAEPAHLLRGFERARVIITAKTSCILFDLYVAGTPEQRSQGLMYIHSMGQYEGMLFMYARQAEISMWMKNTLIPLDMLFLDQQQSISSVHANAVPLSEDIISSGAVVSGVIELNGGAAGQFGIRSGDRITAIWPEDWN